MQCKSDIRLQLLIAKTLRRDCGPTEIRHC